MVKNKKISVKKQPVESQKQGMVFIDFDIKTKLFLGISVSIFFLLVFFKINGSSIALWNNKGPADVDIDKKHGLLMGSPKSIRIDEWARNTPFIFSQYLLDFPKSNPSMGAGNNALPANMPVKDITTLLRPLYWGFFLLDLESGFAWYWNFRLIALLIGFFLMFMLLTRNNFLLSVFGSVWILTSSATQWWTSSYLPEILAYSSLVFVSIVYFIFSENLRIVAFNVLMFVVFSFSFIAVLYPPWQLLCGYLLALILFGYIISNPIKKILKEAQLWKRIGIISLGFVVLALMLIHFYLDLKEYVSIMLATVYPGSRVFAGGEMTVSRLFSGYLFSFIEQGNVPPAWYNICEASGYLLFFPFIIFLVLFSYFKGSKISITIWLICGYIIVMTIWALVGLPPLLAKIMLLSNVSEVRTAAFIGVAGIILVVIYLNENKGLLTTLTPTVRYIFLLGVLIFMYAVLNKINADLIDKVPASKLSGLVIYFSLIHFFLFSKWRWSQLSFFLLLMPFLIPNLLTNPVSAGLDPIMKHPLYSFISQIKDKYSDGRWVVFGQNSAMVANLMKASGVRVFGGTIVAPNIPELEVLDDQKKYNNVYNRYSQCSVVPSYDKPEPEFTLPFADATELHIDPCSDKLRKIGVKYALLLYQPGQREAQCLQLIENQFKIPVFAYKNSDSIPPGK